MSSLRPELFCDTLDDYPKNAGLIVQAVVQEKRDGLSI